MKVKSLSFEHFRQNDERFDNVVLKLKDGEEFIIHDNMDFEFNDLKKRIDCWRYGKYSYVKYDDIVSVSGELL